MRVTSKEIRQILLLSLILLIVPMVVFPKKLGLELAEFSFVNIGVEFVYYGIVGYFLNRQTTLVKLLSVGGVCLVSRLALGSLFGLLIMVLYPIKASVAFSFGLTSYLPSILLQIAAVPFVLYPLVTILLKSSPSSERKPKPQPQPLAEMSERPAPQSSSNLVYTKEKPSPSRREQRLERKRTQPEPTRNSFKKTKETPKPAVEQSNGFDKAVRYIGENGSVLVAAVIDHEGLLLGGFKRCELELEDVTPFALLLKEKAQPTLGKAGFGQPERSVYFFDEQKMVVAYEPYYTLVVIAERTVDDVVNIRINQALEMIKTYIAERYSEKLIANAEKIYV